MEWKFAWSSIITGIILVTSIIFIRLTIDLYTGWNVYMILRPLFFYTLLVISGINLLVNRKCAIFLYKFFSWGIVVERILFVLGIYRYYTDGLCPVSMRVTFYYNASKKVTLKLQNFKDYRKGKN